MRAEKCTVALIMVWLSLMTLPVLAEDQAKLLDLIFKEAPETIQKSRNFMLGERKAGQQSVVKVAKEQQIHSFQDAGTRELLTPVVHPRGGPGTRYYMFNRNRKVSGVMDDFNWHQTKFKAFIKERQDVNLKALKMVERQQSHLEALLDSAEKSKALPDWQAATTLKPFKTETTGWLGYCLNQTRKAMSNKDQAAYLHWLSESEAASYALVDLHRWCVLLYQNQLFNLEVQKNSKELFEALNGVYGNKYNRLVHIARFPGGNASLYGSENYAEVERQAELIFWYDKGWEQSASKPLEQAYLYRVFPDLREDYLQLAESLTRKNLELWQQVPMTNYERSYLMNMIWRAKVSGNLEDMSQVLKRFNKKYSRGANIEALMNVIHIRGSYFAGLEFGDRFSGDLMKISSRLKGKNDRVAKMAQQFTYQLYGGKKNYVGLVLTLRQSQQSGKMDCIRATDMIAAAYRNSGQAGYRMVRMYRGWPSHTVAAIETGTAQRSKVMTIDGLISSGDVRAWPKGYAKRGAYPSQNKNASYAVQLYVRGIDAYLCAEAFYVYGPKQNQLVKSEIPYMAVYRK